MILDALRLGYHVLHTDVDVHFVKNPFNDFHFDVSDKPRVFLVTYIPESYPCSNVFYVQ